MSGSTTGGSLIVPALKSCNSGILRNRINADFFCAQGIEHRAEGIERTADGETQETGDGVLQLVSYFICLFFQFSRV